MQLNDHTLIPFAPDWSFAVKHQHAQRTSVAEGVTGLEERAAWFSRPRLSSRFTIYTDGDERTSTVEETLRTALESAKAAVPLWGREQIAKSSSGKTVTLERTAANIKSGQWLGLAKPCGDIAATAQVIFVNGAIVTLDSPLTAMPGDLLVPIELGRIESVPSELLGGSGRAFEIRFKGNAPLDTISTEFIYTETDTESNWLSMLANLYFMFYIDTSGSMDAEVPHITAAANQLKILLRDVIYGGDQQKVDHFVRIQNWSSERWLERLAYRISGEEAARYVSLAFINEASSGYHYTPRSIGYEPSSTFKNDFNLFQTEFARREFSRCKVYSVNPTSGSWLSDNQAFNGHLTDAVAGTGPYEILSPALATQYVYCETAIPSGRAAQEYLNDILLLLGLQ